MVRRPEGVPHEGETAGNKIKIEKGRDNRKDGKKRSRSKWGRGTVAGKPRKQVTLLFGLQAETTEQGAPGS